MRLYASAQNHHKVLLNELDNLPPERRADVVAKQRRIIAAAESVIAEIAPGGGARVNTMLFFGMINWTHTWFDPAGPFMPRRWRWRGRDHAAGRDASGVVVELDAVALGHRLAGQHVAFRQLLLGEAVVHLHLDFARDDLGAAGRADAALARERRGQAGGAGVVEDVPVAGSKATAAPAVQRDPHLQARRLLRMRRALRLLAADGRRR